MDGPVVDPEVRCARKFADTGEYCDLPLEVHNGFWRCEPCDLIYPFAFWGTEAHQRRRGEGS